MKTINVKLKNHLYSIVIGRNLLSRAGKFVSRLKLGSKILIVTNKKVGARFSPLLKRALKQYQTEVFYLPYGDERDKSLKVLEKIWNQMADIPLDRSSAVVALGGGVIGDVAGFAAATYMRGIPVIQVPTTLLAQVDSAIGGKTAIDLPAAKNIVGSFHQPKFVISDVSTLASLSLSDFRNSLAEVVKYGVIYDPKLFRILERKLAWFLRSVAKRQFGPKEYQFLEDVIFKSASVKARVVEEDERETKGKRMILNYGHTFAHALEGASGYKMAHGHAVAIGMILAGELACRLGLFSADAQRRQIHLIQQLGLPIRFKYSTNQIVNFMKRDKKVKNGKLRFVLPTRIGHVKVVEGISEKVVRNLFRGKGSR